MKFTIKFMLTACLCMLFSLPLTAQNNYVYTRGTSWKFFDVITSTDPTSFQSVSYRTIKNVQMYDREANNNNGAWIQPESYIYVLVYDDNITAEIRIRKNDFSQEEAQRLADKYGRKMGQLPACLRKGVNYINILKSDAVFGGNKATKAIEITIGATSRDYENNGNMEEILLHESTHAAMDFFYTHKDWKTAVRLDRKFISKYAADNPNREDIAESFLCFVGVNLTQTRINANDANTIKNNIPNRLKFFNWFNRDMYPIQVANGPFYPNTWYRLTTQFTGADKSLDIVNDAQDNKLIMSRTGNHSGQHWKIEHAGNGHYRLTTQFTGVDKSLDIVNDAQDNKLIMSQSGNHRGQYWKIDYIGNGYYRLTAAFTGPNKSLDIVNDARDNKLIMSQTGNYTGQYWRITPIKDP